MKSPQEVEQQDIECPRCGRITFSWEKNILCAACSWVVRLPIIDKPYGYDVLIKQFINGVEIITECHSKGKESAARSAAKRKAGFRAILSMVPLTESQYIGAYGEGKM